MAGPNENSRKRKAEEEEEAPDGNFEDEKEASDANGDKMRTKTSEEISNEQDAETSRPTGPGAHTVSSDLPQPTERPKDPKLKRPLNDYDSLRTIVVRNDGKPASMIKLIGLKSLFAKQLPKMPRAYIARLVLDRRHTSLAILSDKVELKDSDDEIIGAICYRAFPEMRFAEIAFCAVNATHQVKGYGTKLMNLLKQRAVNIGIEYFITYADNYAIGYFKKQGFTKTISMPRGRYAGLIKEYDGGTPMECYVHPSVDYTRIPEMIQAQREYILKRIRMTALSHKVVYPPFSQDRQNPPLDPTSGEPFAPTDPRLLFTIPGVTEAGWTLADYLHASSDEADKVKTALKAELLQMMRRINDQQYIWPFREPVNIKEVPDYLEVISHPMDLSTIDKRIKADNYYRNKEMFFQDLLLMTSNCKTYNEDASTYVSCAKKLEKFINDKLR